MQNLTPVEAITRELAFWTPLRDALVTSNCSSRKEIVLVAALELAKAVAAIKNDHLTGCDITMGDSHPCTCGIPRKLADLLEALR